MSRNRTMTLVSMLTFLLAGCATSEPRSSVVSLVRVGSVDRVQSMVLEAMSGSYRIAEEAGGLVRTETFSLSKGAQAAQIGNVYTTRRMMKHERWVEIRGSVLVTLRALDGDRTEVSIRVFLEGYNGEWVALPSNGLLENEIKASIRES